MSFSIHNDREMASGSSEWDPTKDDILCATHEPTPDSNLSDKTAADTAAILTVGKARVLMGQYRSGVNNFKGIGTHSLA